MLALEVSALQMPAVVVVQWDRTRLERESKRPRAKQSAVVRTAIPRLELPGKPKLPAVATKGFAALRAIQIHVMETGLSH